MAKINNMLRETPVAIVGMASIFADSENLEKYWDNILQGIDCIKEVPGDRWKVEDLYDPNPMAKDKSYCKMGGFIPDIDFNPMEFGLPPNLLEVTDASQLLSLLVARDALTDAGYTPGSEEFNEQLRQKTGCILGVGGGQKLITPLTSRLQEPVWRRALEKHNLPEAEIDQIVEKIKAAYIPWTENSFPGMLGNVIAGRVANRFDLGGINSVVDAACAASLSAIKMAVAELIEGRCDMMLTGGVDTDNSPFMYMSFSKTPAFSKKGSIRPFDHEGDGMLIGEGVGMLVLKRLEDAERDGDKIYAVIKGIGGSSDGKFKSIYAPRPAGQALAMRRAYEEAGFGASTVGLIEAHGTGTNAGDAAEGESMKMVFGENDNTKNHIALGSVKSQVGHTKSAAGAAGMIKAALALQHKVLPGTINVTKPNEKMDIENSPLYVNTETRPWFRKDSKTPRRAGISAFGFGGVNLHFVLEEYEAEQEKAYRVDSVHQTVLLQAPNEQALKAIVAQHSEALAKADDPAVYLKKLAIASAKDRIPAAHVRLGFVVSSVKEAENKLDVAAKMLEQKAGASEWAHPLMGIYYRVSAKANDEKVVAIFAGQGSQYTNMGRELAVAYPAIREAFYKANETFEGKGEKPLTDTVYPIPVFSEEERKAQQTKLTQTQNAQPAIGALSAGMFQLMKNAGFDADFFAGHSYGELTALWASGVLSEKDFYQLSKARGEAMGAPNSGEASTMLAVKADVSEIEAKIKAYADVQVANVNSATQTILGGSTASLTKLKDELKAQGFLSTLLPVSAAFHTPFVGHAQKPFAQAVAQVNFQKSDKTVFSNTSGKAYTNNPSEYSAVLTQHMLNPVLFKNQIENIYAAGGRVFVEFGPKNILSNLVKDILGDRPHQRITLNANPKKNSQAVLLEAVVQLAVLGIEVQGFDTFALNKVLEKPKAKISITINGANYVSDGYKKKYQDLLDAPAAGRGEKKTEEKSFAEEIETVMVETQDVAAVFQEKILEKKNKELEESMAEKELLNQIQEDIKRLTDQQSRIEQMLTALFSMQSENQLGQGTAQAQPVAQLAQAEVSSNGYSANGHSNNGFAKQAVQEVTAQVEDNTSTVSTSAVTNAEIEASLMEVIAEKTGYPSEMLEMGMDMEADLG
ncbi:MAG: acyltransferase domain-containing protein, partial [Cytophagales bacterium]|nr:acyltransferase domain-containing protein [Cytophagales bacterium]